MAIEWWSETTKKSSKLQQKWPRIEKAILTVWFPLLRRYVHYRQVWNRVSSSFEFQVRLDFFNGSYQNSEQSHQKNCNFLASQVIFQSWNVAKFLLKIIFIKIYLILIRGQICTFVWMWKLKFKSPLLSNRQVGMCDATYILRVRSDQTKLLMMHNWNSEAERLPSSCKLYLSCFEIIIN